jgi:hypothetical protein
MPKQTRSGDISVTRVPYNAHETFAESEFNRYYIRGLSARAIAEGIEKVEVYRGKPVIKARPESQAKIRELISAETLLNDLRNSIGKDTALGIPSGPKSGLTVRLPK